VERFGVAAQRKSPRRFAFIAGVIGLHAAFIAGVLLQDKVSLPTSEPAPFEVTLLLRPLPPRHLPKPLPAKKSPREKSNAITLAPTPPQETLGAIGRYLACQSHYQNLSAEERALCAFPPWAAPDATTALVLGAQATSIWAQALARRKAPFVPMFVPCPLDATGVNAEAHRLGLDCANQAH
jgi:hypothetical protein